MLTNIKLIIYYSIISKLPNGRFLAIFSKIRLAYLEKFLKIKEVNAKYSNIERFENDIYISNALNVRIGYGCQINENVFIQSAIIGNFVMLAPNVALLHDTHNYDRVDIPMALQGKKLKEVIIIEDDVWIGRNSIIMPGIRICKGCIVAAGSIVTKDTEPYSVVGGIPAKLIRFRI